MKRNPIGFMASKTRGGMGTKERPGKFLGKNRKMGRGRKR